MGEWVTIGGFDDQEYGVAEPLWLQQYREQKRSRTEGLIGTDPNLAGTSVEASPANRGLSEADAILVGQLGRGGLRDLKQQVQNMIRDGERF